MNRNAWRVRQQVEKAWEDAILGMKKMNSASAVLPSQPSKIFADDDAPQDVVKLNVGPVVFHVPERPDRPPNLFIVVRGWLSFEGPDFKSRPLITRDFATRVAYFRSKPQQLEHVYGAHYDMNEQDGRHPVFHAQFGSYAECATHIKTLFKRVDAIDDCVGHVLRNVRIPTAQMDVFSVLTQICADHLLGETPAHEVSDGFQNMRAAGSFLMGAAHRMAFLGTGSAVRCYRATHWYGADALPSDVQPETGKPPSTCLPGRSR